MKYKVKTTRAHDLLRKEVVYPHPPAAVWAALTDSRAIAEWLMPNTFQPVAGGRFGFRTDPMPMCAGKVDCEILELVPQRRLVYSWANQPKPGKKSYPPSRVAWTLTPEGSGTRLVLEHTGLANAPRFIRWSMGFGWGTMMSRWIPRVMANVRDGVFTPGAIPLEKRCYKARTVPPEFVR